MIGQLTCVAALMLGIDVGWQPSSDGGVEYLIQLQPEAIEALKAGQPLESYIPGHVKDVRAYRITIGTAKLRRELPLEIPESKTSQPTETRPSAALPPATLPPATLPPATLPSPAEHPTPTDEPATGEPAVDEAPRGAGNRGSDLLGSRYQTGNLSDRYREDFVPNSGTGRYGTASGGYPGAADTPSVYPKRSPAAERPEFDAQPRHPDRSEVESAVEAPGMGGLGKGGRLAVPNPLAADPARKPLVAAAATFTETTDVTGEVSTASPSTQLPEPEVAPDDNSDQAPRLIAALGVLVVSLSLNVYLLWIAFEARRRCRQVLSAGAAA